MADRDALLVNDGRERALKGEDPNAVRKAKLLIVAVSLQALAMVAMRTVEASSLRLRKGDQCVEYEYVPKWVNTAWMGLAVPYVIGLVVAAGVERSLRHCTLFARHKLLVVSVLVTDVLMPAAEGQWNLLSVPVLGFAVYDTLWERLGMWQEPLRVASSLLLGTSTTLGYLSLMLERSRCDVDPTYLDHLATAASTQILLWLLRSLRATTIIPRGNVMLGHDLHVSYKGRGDSVMM